MDEWGRTFASEHSTEGLRTGQDEAENAKTGRDMMTSTRAAERLGGTPSSGGEGSEGSRLGSRGGTAGLREGQVIEKKGRGERSATTGRSF